MTEQRIPRPAIGATAKRVLGPVLRTHLDRGHRQGLRALRSGAPPDWPRGGVGAGLRVRYAGNRRPRPGRRPEDRRAQRAQWGRETLLQPGGGTGWGEGSGRGDRAWAVEVEAVPSPCLSSFFRWAERGLIVVTCHWPEAWVAVKE